MHQPCVLVVEDEPFMRMMLADQLRDDASLSIEAENADVAVEVLGKEPEVRVIITDVRMPGTMDGMELAGLVATCWPHLKVFITSGHVSVRDSELPSEAAFVPKPCIAGAFTKLLRAALH